VKRREEEQLLINTDCWRLDKSDTDEAQLRPRLSEHSDLNEKVIGDKADTPKSTDLCNGLNNMVDDGGLIKLKYG